MSVQPSGSHDGLHIIPLPLDERRTVNAILVEGSPLTLVDTGLGQAESLALLQAGLDRHGYRLRDIEQIVITHAHLDHFGAAAAIIAASGARVLGDAGGADQMAGFAEHWATAQAYRLRLFHEAGAPPEVIEATRRWGEHYARQGESICLDGGLQEGDSLTLDGRPWRVLSVPGHAASSIALHDAERGLLLSGDIVVGIGSTNVTLHQVGHGARPAGWQLTIADSIRSLAALPVRRIYPGHGEVIEDAPAALEDRLRRIDGRLAEVQSQLSAAPHTAYEVAQAIYEPAVAGSMAGLSQAIGYLDALEARGRAVAEAAGGRRRYRAANGAPGGDGGAG